MLDDLMARELPQELGDLVQNELSGGERIAWTGQPRDRFPIASLAVVLFGIPWTAFSLFWMWGVSGFSHPEAQTPWFVQLFALFGLPFVIIGVIMLTSPWWMRRALRRTVYVVTDRRAFILTAGRGATVRSFDGSQLRGLERRERPDGSGDLVIQPPSGNGSDRLPAVGLMDIPEVRRVEELVRRLPGQAPPSP